MLILISCRCGSCAGGDQGEEGLDDQANTVSEITSYHVKNLKSITDTFQVLDTIRPKKVKVKKITEFDLKVRISLCFGLVLASLAQGPKKKESEFSKNIQVLDTYLEHTLTLQ